MMEQVNQIKSIITSNFTINHTFTGGYEDYIPEAYPSICLAPQAMNKALGDSLSFDDFDENDSIAVYYVNQAPENRDQSAFITKIDSVTSTLMANPRLNGQYNMGVEIGVEYTQRDTQDNIEFIAKITIEGRNV